MQREVSYARILLLGFGFLSITMAWSLFNSYVPIFLRDFVESTALVGVVMSLDNVAGMTLQPWFGALSDRTRTRIGRRMPFLVAGMPLAAVSLAALPLAGSLGLLIAAILAVDLSMSIFRAPTVALMPDLTPPGHRSRANGIINFMGGVGAFLALSGGSLLYRQGRAYPFFAAALLMLAVLVLLLRSVREPEEPTDTAQGELSRGLWRVAVSVPRENPELLWALLGLFGWSLGLSAIEAFLTTYAVTVLGWHESEGAFLFSFFALAYILSSIPGGWVGERAGARRVLAGGLLALTLLVACAPWLRSPVTLGAGFVFAGVAWGFVTVNAYPLVVQLGSQRTIGASTGLYYLATSLAASAGPPLAGAVMDLLGNASLFGFSAVSFFAALLCILRSARLSQARASIPLVH